MKLNAKGHAPRDEIELKVGDKVAICRCWQSDRFPYCDGSHCQHNEASKDNLGPAIIKVGDIE